MELTYCIKSGTGGYTHYDGCDLFLKEVQGEFVPRRGDTVEFKPNGQTVHSKYRVVEVEVSYPSRTVETKECISIYVIPY